MKYEVTTTLKTLAQNINLETAMAIAEQAAKTHTYVEVKQVLTDAPYYTKSVKIFM